MKYDDLTKNEDILRFIGKKWVLSILKEFDKEGAVRFNQLKQSFEITSATLSTILKKLESNRIIKKKIYHEFPTRIDYLLTEKGKRIINFIKELDNQSNKTILIVDDDIDLKESTGLLLKEDGYNVVLACDGRQAIKKYEATKPDLTLMDIVMPGMDGYDAFFKIHEIDPNAKVVLVTGFTIEDDRYEKAKKKNLIDTLYKPVDIDVLLEIIKRHA
ncbi:MAG: response regulator [Thaumarchaeota archaeon]|nr:response regulator [Nitrososphaerota archaeon]